MPLLVRSGAFFFFLCLKLALGGQFSLCAGCPCSRDGISNLARGPIIRVLMAVYPPVSVCKKALHTSQYFYSKIVENVFSTEELNVYGRSRSAAGSI